MQKALFAAMILLLSIIGNAQNSLKSFVQDNTVAILTVQPDSTDYTDLAAIGKSIGDARIVMLGEQDHGDAPVFLAKTRLIKYLHEKLGFNVLAFESDFFGLNFGYDRLEKNKSSLDTFIKGNIFPIWTYCNTCSDLFYNYLPSTLQTTTPLLLSGFDNQMSHTFASKYLTFYLDSVLMSLDLPVTKQPNYKTEILPLIDSLKYFFVRDKDVYIRRKKFLSAIKNQAAGKIQDNDFWMLVINNLLAENEEYNSLKSDFRYANNIRDFQMAENLKWLTTAKFPKQKIIVWAANSHVAKYGDTALGSADKRLISMGKFFTADSTLLSSTYIIGFTSYAGEAGRLGTKTFSVSGPKPNGFENWINASYNYAFVDFKIWHNKFPGKTENFYLKALTHNTRFQGDWTQVFDGVFFIREMYPCKRI